MTKQRRRRVDRRQTLKCMLWAGTGVVWTMAGGVPASSLIGAAKAAEGGFSFVQLSDSHIGFSKPANPDARATFDVAIDKVLAMPGDPAFIIQTGDVTHTAKPAEFDDALQMIKRASSTSIIRRASTTSPTPRPATPGSSGSARAGAAAGTPSITAACISCRSSTWST